jgi:hypothetical protein
MSDVVAAALVTGGFSVVVAMLEWTRRQNNRDHGENSRKLDRIEGKIDSHINDHAKGEFQ